MAPNVLWFEEGNGAQYGLHEKIFTQKVAQKSFGQFGEIRAKILRTPKNLPAPTPMQCGIPVCDVIIVSTISRIMHAVAAVVMIILYARSRW